MKKPPSFPFYAKDWRSSATVRSMTREMRADYIDLLAAAWDSDEPGTLPLPVEIAAKIASIDVRSLVNLRAKFPQCFVQVGNRLVNHKLHDYWLRILQFQEVAGVRGKKGADARWHKNASSIKQAMPNDGIAVAVAVASALKSNTNTKPRVQTPHASSPNGSAKAAKQKRNIEARNRRLQQEDEMRAELNVGKGWDLVRTPPAALPPAAPEDIPDVAQAIHDLAEKKKL